MGHKHKHGSLHITGADKIPDATPSTPGLMTAQQVVDLANAASSTWLRPVISSLDIPPVTPLEGDRYRIVATAVGVWTGLEGQLAEWIDGAWAYTIPEAGYVVCDIAADDLLRYSGAAWLDAGYDAAEIKALYESNPDTNAFTDTEKTKLFGIEEGAQVNVAETDPVVGAVTGLVKSDGAGNIAAATPGAGNDYLDVETDPVVGAVSGIVKSDGLGSIQAATPGPGNDYLDVETDPVVGAIAGLVKSDGVGTIEAAIPGPGNDYLNVETDPVVGAVAGIVKSDGVGTIEAAVPGPGNDYLNVETDPVVGAVSGIVKSDGLGNIAAAIADTDYQTVPVEGAFADGDKAKLDRLVTEATPIVPTGSPQDIDWANGSLQTLDLGSAVGDVTLTFSNVVPGERYVLRIIQGPTPYDVILPASVKLPGGTAPSTLDISITDNAVDRLTLDAFTTEILGTFTQNHG